MRRQSTIFSVFDQVGDVIARSLVKEGKATLIKPEDIPPTARWDKEGRVALCAIACSVEVEREFDQRAADLRA